MVKSDGPKRALTFADVFCLGLNAIIGSGIFLFPGHLAALAGPASIAAFLVCALLLCMVALCYAELGGMFRESGATYVYAREAFGEEAGYGIGFISWAAAALSGAAVASIMAGYVGYFSWIFGTEPGRRALAAGSIALFAAVNYRGIKPGARTVNLLTAAKVLPLVFFVIAGFAATEVERFFPFYGGEKRFAYAVFLSLWALSGFEVVGVPAGETENPQRDVPRAVVGSLLFAGIFYAIIQTAAVGAFPGLSLSRDRPLADAAAFFLGPWGGGVMAVAGTVSMTGFLAGESLGTPRFLSALGSRSLRRWNLAETHPRFGTPHRSILITAAVSIVLVLVFDFTKLIDLANLTIVTQFLATCAAAMVLRVRRPDAARPYRVPLIWAVAPVGCAIAVWLMRQVSTVELMTGVGILVVGYWLRAWLDWGGEDGE